jgi:cytochrome c-type biogenesis protein
VLDAPYALAVAAGLLAAVNPCGFALLPAYLSVIVLDSDGGGRGRATARALGMTAAMTAGFAGVFGVFGLLTAPVAGQVARNLPWVSIVLGLGLVGLGGWLLAGRQLPNVVPKLGTGPAVTGRVGSMVLFGAGYAVASLGCTVGPFLAVVVAGFRTDSIAAGVGLFLAYAAGMALVVGTVALAVALAKMSLVRRVRRAAPLIGRIGGTLMVVAGGYVAWYGWYEIRVLDGGDTGDPVVDAAVRLQSTVAGWLDRLGPGTVAVAFAVLLATATLGTAWARLRGRGRMPVAEGGGAEQQPAEGEVPVGDPGRPDRGGGGVGRAERLLVAEPGDPVGGQTAGAQHVVDDAGEPAQDEYHAARPQSG